MNQFIFTGRLTKDPEIKQSKNNKSFTTFNLAVDRKFKKEGQTNVDFFFLIVWGKLAENICKYCRKGSRVLAKGYEETQTKDNKTETQHIVTECEFLSSKPSQDSGKNQLEAQNSTDITIPNQDENNDELFEIELDVNFD